MSGFELIPKTDFEDIAAAIRSKTGKSALLKSGEMADEIESIEGTTGSTEWYGTQSQYDNLESYDPDTLYFITGE